MTPLPANRARGEVLSPLSGEPRRLCLTLGGLAEIETALGLEAASALGERLRSPSARDLMVVLGALLRGGGESAFAEALPTAAVDPAEAVAAIAAAFSALG